MIESEVKGTEPVNLILPQITFWTVLGIQNQILDSNRYLPVEEDPGNTI
jgi:hypothetical protein